MLFYVLPVVVWLTVSLLPVSLHPSPPRETPLQIIQRYAAKHNLDWKLVLAVAIVESECNPLAVSRKGARGLLQVMPIHAKYARIPVVALFDMETNLNLGCAYLREMIDRFGLYGGIQAYNLGESRYERGKRANGYLGKVVLRTKTLEKVLMLPRAEGER